MLKWCVWHPVGTARVRLKVSEKRNDDDDDMIRYRGSYRLIAEKAGILWNEK